MFNNLYELHMKKEPNIAEIKLSYTEIKVVFVDLDRKIKSILNLISNIQNFNKENSEHTLHLIKTELDSIRYNLTKAQHAIKHFDNEQKEKLTLDLEDYYEKILDLENKIKIEVTPFINVSDESTEKLLSKEDKYDVNEFNTNDRENKDFQVANEINRMLIQISNSIDKTNFAMHNQRMIIDNVREDLNEANRFGGIITNQLDSHDRKEFFYALCLHLVALSLLIAIFIAIYHKII